MASEFAIARNRATVPRQIEAAHKTALAKGEVGIRDREEAVRVAAMLKKQKAKTKSIWVFPGDSPEASILGTSLDHQHEDVRKALGLPKDFVIHSLRHTMPTRLGEAGADAFTIMKIAGHSSVTVSQRYVHPTPEGLERAFERLDALNAAKFEEAVLETKSEAINASGVPTPRKRRALKSLQIIEFKATGP
jgi:hypothetical protein